MDIVLVKVFVHVILDLLGSLVPNDCQAVQPPVQHTASVTTALVFVSMDGVEMIVQLLQLPLVHPRAPIWSAVEMACV